MATMNSSHTPLRVQRGAVLKGLCLISFILASSAVAAQSDTSALGQRPRYSDPEVTAVTACLTAFTQELFPGSASTVHTVVQHSHVVARDEIYWRSAEVQMNATLRSTGKPIAHSDCHVSRAGQIRRMYTHVENKALLAALKQQDLSVQVTRR
jgi:hypothetical protein